MRLKDKVAIITGGARGMGSAESIMFANEGAKVVIADIRREMGEDVAHKIRQNGGTAEFIWLDVTSEEQWKSLLVRTISLYGKLDILVNNAGITRDNLLMRMQEEDFNQVIKVNLNSVFNMTKAVQKTMLKQRSGSIINMSSVVGVKGNAGQSNYAASKAGIIGFSKSIALELGSRNIRCNVIAPGFIETEMTKKLDEKIIENWRNSIPLKRGGTPVDVANACVWLASDMSSYVTGQVLNIDGGLLT